MEVRTRGATKSKNTTSNVRIK